MSFFKILSDKAEDFEQEESSINCDIQEEDFPDSYDIQPSRLNDCIELILDTGEQFCIPLDWLICVARRNQFYSETDHNGFIH